MALFPIQRAFVVMILTIVLYLAVVDADYLYSQPQPIEKTCGEACTPGAFDECTGECNVCHMWLGKCAKLDYKTCFATVENREGCQYIHKLPKPYTGDYLGTIPRGEKIELTGRVTVGEFPENHSIFWYNHKGGYIPVACIATLEAGPWYPWWCN